MLAAWLVFGPAAPPQSCTQCRKPWNADLRVKWGCDAPTSAPQVKAMSCPCFRQDPSCRECGGSGKISIHRCPRALVQEVHYEVCRAVTHLEVGILPAAGGWGDQSASMVQAMKLVLSEKAAYEKQRAAAARAQSAAQMPVVRR